jgi:hypothetical protein
MEFHEDRNYGVVATTRLQIHGWTYGRARSSRKVFFHSAKALKNEEKGG